MWYDNAPLSLCHVNIWKLNLKIELREFNLWTADALYILIIHIMLTVFTGVFLHMRTHNNPLRLFPMSLPLVARIMIIRDESRDVNITAWSNLQL